MLSTLSANSLKPIFQKIFQILENSIATKGKKSEAVAEFFEAQFLDANSLLKKPTPAAEELSKKRNIPSLTYSITGGDI